jgi:hypothetical protein
MAWQRAKAWMTTGLLLLTTASPFTPIAAAQRGRDGHDNYYNGMYDHMRDRRYEDRYRRDERDHHHDDSGGIGPGYGALIGGGGGAALGALFGGGLKGTLIGGAAGAGLGALGGKLAQGDDNDHHHRH